MCPEQSALGGGHHYSPRVQAGSGGQRGGPQPGAHPGAEEVPVQPALLSRDLARHPGPPPHFPAADGQAEEEQAAGLARGGPHRKRHCSWSCDSKKHRMPGSPPPLWPLPPPRRPTPGRSEQDRVGQRPSPSPWTSRPSTARLLLPGPPATAIAGRFSNTPPPCLCLWCLDGSFWAFPLDLAQRAPPPGSPPARHVGQLPTLRLIQPLWASPTQP